jgi:hypothetical protein
MGGCDCGLEDVAEKRFGWLFNFFIGAVLFAVILVELGS